MADGFELTLWSLAIGGTLIFVMKLVLMFVGMDGHGDADFHDGGFDHDVSHDHIDGDSTQAFNLLSLQSLACLAMGTGWMGLAAGRNFNTTAFEALGLGLTFGLGLVYLLGKLLQQARRLESSGTLDVRNAVGRSGTVYMNIPTDHVGQIQIVVQGRLATLEARTTGSELLTGMKVRVDSVDPNGTLVVAPLEHAEPEREESR